MAISINSMWVSVQNQVNVWRTGFISPSKFNDYLQQASIELFNEKRLAALQNDKIDDDLAPFLKSENLPVTVPVGLNYGLVTRPATQYNYFWSMRAFFTGKEESLESCGCPESDNTACDARKNLLQTPVSIDQIPIVKEVRVTKVSGTVWDSVLNHRTKFPTTDRAFCSQIANGFKVAPRNLSIVTLDNYRLPTTAVFGYTALPSGYYQFNQGASTDIEWPAQVFDELLDRILIMCGVQLKNQPLFNAAETQKATRT